MAVQGRKTLAGGALLALLVAGCSAASTPATSSSSPPLTVPTSSSTLPAALPPSSTAVPSASSPATPASVPALSDPASVVEAYFAAINDHDYARAWSLGGSHFSASFAQFAAGFADTAQDSVIIVSTSGHKVTVLLTALHADGSQQQFSGTYTVTGQQITAASVIQVGAASATASLCGAPANPYGYNFCGHGSHITSPPSDICSYFTCIGNFPHGRGYMVECQDGTFSLSGGIRGACSDHRGVSQALYSG